MGSLRIACKSVASFPRRNYSPCLPASHRPQLPCFLAPSSPWQMITLGGDAELELVDSMDPFAEGIVFSVRPPKKSWKNICNLSGGEKVRRGGGG